MSPAETLAYETRHRTRQMSLAAAGGVLLMVAAIVSLIGPHAVVSELTLSLVYEHRRAGLSILAAVINGVAELAVGATLVYLWRCATTRGDRKAPWVPITVGIGVALALIGGLGYAFDFTAKASDFVAHGTQTYDEANRLTDGAVLLILQVLSQLGALLIAISFIVVSLLSMRVGLLPRFLAYVGMFAGVLVLFPIIVVPIVQLYFLAAIAILFAGSWPSGLPPAWRTGQAEPWPSSAEMRARRMAENDTSRERRGEQKRRRRERVSDAPAPTAEPVGGDASSGASAERTRATTARRKRKRKH